MAHKIRQKFGSRFEDFEFTIWNDILDEVASLEEQFDEIDTYLGSLDNKINRVETKAFKYSHEHVE